ncbi:protein kinase [Streptomyces sp. NPDC057253]|uniref:serine/threonine-protein kinase n=1 Tax=Streptomyces sp. NPDC057253 TaxID=3346069 RepID=UPI003644C099
MSENFGGRPPEGGRRWRQFGGGELWPQTEGGERSLRYGGQGPGEHGPVPAGEPRPPYPARPGPAVPPTRYDRPDPRTGYQQPPATRAEPGRTPRSGGPAPLHLLPTALRDRYEVVGHRDGGAEADILIAADRTVPGAPAVVVKTYRRQLPHAEDVWARLATVQHPHLARLVESGHSDGRQYEVMEWIPGSPLSDLIPGPPWPPAAVTEAVRQLTDALAALHRLGIVHRDLKAENVILRDGTPGGPPHLVLIDFGLSRLDEEYRFTDFAAGTDHYLAPELLLRGGGASTQARDWWALGMLLRELLTGARNFTGFGSHALYEAIVLRPVQLDAVTDPRARLLCRGLLTVDRDDRWGAGEIGEWLRGGSPPVVSPAHRQPDLPPLTLFGRTFRDGASLAQALREPGFWQALSESLAASTGDRESLPLYPWLHSLAVQRQVAAAVVERLVGTLADPALAPDVRVLRLLHWLDPAGRPMWRGLPMDRDALGSLAQRAADGAEEDVRLVDEVWRWRLLPEFARFAGSDGLRGTAETWQSYVHGHPAAVARVLPWIPRVHQQPPRGTPPPPPESPQLVLAPLLALALNPALADTRSSELRRIFAAQDTAPVPVLPGTTPEMWQLTAYAPQWYTTVRRGEEDLRGGPDGDPVGLEVLRDYAPYAVADARDERARRHAALAADQGRLALWADKERQRTNGRIWAQLRAALPLLGYILLLVVVGAGWARVAPGLAVLTVPGVLVAVFQFAGEVSLAGRIAGQYGPDYRLFGRRGRNLQQAGQASRGLFRGFMTLTLILLVLALLPVLWPVAAVAHFVSLRRRRNRWERMYEVERGRVLGRGPS